MSRVYVRADGCIRLGNLVTCDGFSPSVPIRIQTHIHYDHLKDFERSKGAQRSIVFSHPTYELLVAEFNADLPYRKSQMRCVAMDGRLRRVGDTQVALFPAGHMLGCAMCEVRDSSGKYVYTSDFSWPLHHVPKKPDVMVVDATYGDPAAVRNYDEETVIDALVDRSRKYRRNGSLAIIGHRGRLQSAMQIFNNEEIPGPFLASPRVFRTLEVYMRHKGFYLEVYELGSRDARRLIREGEPYIAFVEMRERTAQESIEPNSRILLSAFMVPKQEPIFDHSNGLTRVAFTDHADFAGTIELINTVKPNSVIADGSRGGNADALAAYIRNELGIAATSDVKPVTPDWGSH